MSEEYLEGRMRALRELCVILLDRHCRDRRIVPKSVTPAAQKASAPPLSEDAADGYDSEMAEVLKQLQRLQRAETYRAS